MSSEPQSIAVLGSRLSRFSAIYGLGSGLGLGISVVALLLTTFYLEPDQFGVLAVCLVVSSGLTLLYNLGSLQGSFRLVFGAAGEDGDDDGAADSEEDEEVTRGDKRRALGTAIVVTASIALVGTLLLWPLAPTLDSALLGDDGATRYIHITLFLGAVGACWRLLINIPRLERRPIVFVTLNTARPLLVIAILVPVLRSGAGIEGALLANLVGNIVAAALVLLVIRDSFRPTFSARDARRILLLGRRWVVIVTALWVANNADVLLLNYFAPAGDVGNYRLAGRLCVVLSFAGSAFFMAWLPFRRSAIFQAVNQEHGRRVNALLAQYYMVLVAGILLVLSVGSDVLVGLAPAAYAPAATLVPLVAVAVAAQGVYYMVYRVSFHPKRRRDYILAMIAGSVVLVAVACLLIPSMGSTGAALAPTIGFGAATVCLLLRSQLGPRPVPFDVMRTVGPVLLAAALFGAEQLAAASGVGSLHVLAGVGALVAYPVLLVVLGLVTKGQLEVLRHVVRGAGPARGLSARYADRIASLPERDEQMLHAAATGAPVDPEARSTRLVPCLRTVGDLPPRQSDRDPEVAAHLLSGVSLAERDIDARALIDSGVDARDLHEVTTVLETLRRQRRRIWRQVGQTEPAPVRSRPTPSADRG